ncbi:hypothetical protein PA598K_04377 [Paenibacillus sp. 598K]|uniref:MBL fold metallo-hydrolase n=1 Tax=Paenibacillus sp. 598K TaxID=1117987 RepID=UPI000FF99C32|nr:MBL fold metallo-hydrolase [Paenibacillus sp. 598K]GBF75941.1 hypothetical protein PA598K_04377 [Paenibacillus sp. 598K]
MNNTAIAHIYGSSYIHTGKHAVGIYLDRSSGDAILIDSGANEQAAREIDEALEEEGYRIAAVLHTHGHRSSCGGDAYLLAQDPDLRIYATAASAARAHPPQSLPHLSGGSHSARASQAPLRVTDILPDGDAQVTIGDVTMRVIALPGHAPGMVGLQTPDDVLYCGDALFGERVLRRQSLLLYASIEDARATFRKLSQMAPKAYVLYHGGVLREINALINPHLERLNSLTKRFEDLIATQPITLERLVQQTMQEHALDDSLEHYGLAMQIVQSHVAELLRMDRISLKVEQGALHFASR